MSRKSYKSLILMTLILLLTGWTGAGAQGDDPDQPDTVYVDSVISYTTGIGVVPVRFVNDQILTGLEVTLRLSSLEADIDSFSFAGGRVEAVDSKGTPFSADSRVITIFAIGQIPVGSGLLGTLYCSWSDAIAPQHVEVDSTTTIGYPEHSTFFSYQDGQAYISFIPQFQQGLIDIREAPAGMDSVWIDHAVGQPGEPVAIGVNFFNEADVQDIVVALDYGSNYLQYDSVSFVGTRPLPPIINSQPVQNQNSTHELLLRMTFDESEPLLPGTGLIASLFFTVQIGTPDTTIVIDTTAFAGFWHSSVTRTPAAGGISFTPFFGCDSVEIQTTTDVRDVTEGALPTSFALDQNYPNPFNPSTQIRFSLPSAGQVSIDVFNILGRRVRRLVDEQLPAGVHEVTFDSRSDRGKVLASGIYFYRIETGEFSESRKMLLLK